MSTTTQQQALRELLQGGTKTAKELCQKLRISQTTFSRIVSSMSSEILVSGKARSTRYSLRQKLSNIETEIPLYEVREDGMTLHAATLSPIYKGFYLQSHSKNLSTKFYDDIPFFLDDMRPNGFLGRLVPQIHTQDQYPQDIRLWNSQHCLHYFTHYCWDAIGNYILGDAAFKLFQKKSRELQEVKAVSLKRSQQYEVLAQDILRAGQAGSSAAGEQSKFQTAYRKESKVYQVIVKFSPPITNAIAQRRADLLVAEHLAHVVLHKHGIKTLESEIIESNNRMFLEVQRFDRTPLGGRQGVLSLAALDSQYLGNLGSWTSSTKQLYERGYINEQTKKDAEWLDIFGDLIANTDRHLWNISLIMNGEYPQIVAPIYDMLPMLYAPQQEQIIDRKFTPESYTPKNKLLWIQAQDVAMQYWAAISQDTRVSTGFQDIARNNLKILQNIS